MLSSKVGKPPKFGEVVFVHLPGTLPSSKGRKLVSHLYIPIHSTLQFAELAGVTGTCTAPE